MTQAKYIAKCTAYAARCISEGKTNRRSFDRCFEDGKEIADAVVMRLVHKALNPPPVAITEFGKSYAMNSPEYKAIVKYRNWERFAYNMKAQGWLDNWLPFYEQHMKGL